MSTIQHPPAQYNFDSLPETITDPAHFVVRNQQYPQIGFYPYACAAITDELVARDRARAADEPAFGVDHVANFVRRAIELNAGYFTTDEEGRPDFGQLQERWKRDTTNAENEKYGPPVQELRQRVAPGSNPDKYWLHYITVPRHYSRKAEDGDHEDPEDATEQVRLTGFKYDPKEPEGNRLRILHPPGREIKNDIFTLNSGERIRLNDEHLWGLVTQSFNEALAAENGSPEALNAALRCYGYLSHDKTMRRGQASLAGIVLQYLAQKKEVTVPFAKAPVDYHMQALCRTPDEFVQEFPRLADPDATSATIMDWHRTEAQRQFKEVDLPQRLQAHLIKIAKLICDTDWHYERPGPDVPSSATVQVSLQSTDPLFFTGLLSRYFNITAEETGRSGDKATFTLSTTNQQLGDARSKAIDFLVAQNRAARRSDDEVTGTPPR